MSFLLFFGRLMRWLWNGLMGLGQLLLSLAMLLIVAFLGTSYLSNRPSAPKPKTTLVLDLSGHLVEQAAPRTDSLLNASLLHQNDAGDIELRTIRESLEAAAKDPAIDRLLLKTDDMQVSGLTILREVAWSIDRFKASGKPVIAWADHYDQRQYFLAAHANQVYMDPTGQVLFQGFGHYRNYYRDALDRLGIKVNFIRVGTYKSFGEPFIANGPSPASQEADQLLYHSLWSDFTQAIEGARHQPAGTIDQQINTLPQAMQTIHGNAAQLALDQHWLEALLTPQQLTNMLKKDGHAESDGKDYRQISLDEYASRLPEPKGHQSIAVIVASGEIRDGDAPAGAIGGLTTANLIHDARDNDDVKAVVLRVDSPGGSAHASELIRRELALTQEAGKPVIISMGNLAASGGYWLSLSADEVIADPDTITGSIGVFALIPTADGLMNKFGVHSGGITTTWLSDADNLLRPLDPRLIQILQSGVGHLYQDFVQRTATARRLSPAAVDAVAQGRVWTGQQAFNDHLVDRLGNFQDALERARQRAHLSSDAAVRYIDPNPSPWQRWLGLLDQSAGIRVSLLGGPQGSWITPFLAPLGKDLTPLIGPLINGQQINVPLTHCLCQALP